MKNQFKRHPNIIIFAVYIFLTLIFTVPVIFEITSNIPGGHDAFETFSYSFTYESINIFEHFRDNPQQIFNFRSYLLILHKIIGEPLAYNIIWFLAFILSSFGAYLLCNYLLNNKFVAFIGGFIFAFSPLHFGYALSFGGANHIEFIPFFVLFFIKFLDNLKIRHLFSALIFFIFIIINEPHFAAYTTLFILITGFYYLFKKKLYKNRKFIVYLSTILILGLTIVFLIYRPLIKISTSEQNFLNPGLQAAIYFSNDLATFVTPGYLHPIWGNFFLKNIADKFSGNSAEWSAYIGFIPLFFLLYTIFFYRKQNKQVNFWIFIFVFFLTMSLGPYLRFLGLIEPKISLPYLLIYKYVPFFENIRAIGRSFIYASLALSILVSFGIKFFIEKYRISFKNIKIIPVIIIFFLIAIEYWSVPNTSSIKIPTIYQTLNQDKENYAILQPGITSSHGLASMFIYYNSIHNKKIIGGFHFAREDPNLFQFEKKIPVINYILYDLSYGFPTKDLDFISHNNKNISNLVLNKNNIKYIILHKKLADWDIGAKNFIKLNNFIKNNIQTEEILNDKDTIVYKVKQLENYPQSIIVQKEDGWSEMTQASGGEFVSHMKMQGSSLIIKNYANKNKKIKIILSPRQANNFRKLKVYFNGDDKGEYFIGPNKKFIILYLDHIKPGNNTIELFILDANGNKINISENDTAYFSVSYKEIEKIDKPKLYDALSGYKKDGNILQIPISTNYNFDNEKLVDKGIIQYEELFFNQECKSLEFNKVFTSDGLKFIVENSDLKQLEKNAHTCFKKINVKYLIVHKEFLSFNELNNLLSFISIIFPNKKILANNEEIIAYQIMDLNEEKINKPWTASFESGNFNEWDIVKGSKNEIKIVNDAHSGKYAAQLDFKFGQSFNGFIKNFESPVDQATAEGWIKVTNWARGFIAINFDFIYNRNTYFDSKMWGFYNFFLRDYLIGEIYKNGLLSTFGHNVEADKWTKLKIERDKNGTLNFYENDKIILSNLDYNKKPIYGFKIGVNGCCKESRINLVVDDFSMGTK